MTETVTCKATSGTYIRSDKPAQIFYAASKTAMYVRKPGAVNVASYFRTAMPTNLLGREVLSAEMHVPAVTGASRTLELQAHGPFNNNGGYPALNYNNRPGTLAGSSAHSDGPNNTPTRVFDVTADLQAVADGGPWYGWRLITSDYTAADWKIWGWGAKYQPVLFVELGDQPGAPRDIRPSGITSLEFPIFTWTAPSGLVSVEVELDEEDGDFASPIYASGDVDSLTPTLDLSRSDLPGGVFAGLDDDDVVDVRIRHTTNIGTSDWSDVITVTRNQRSAVTITSPGSTTSDPTPPVVWDEAGVRFQLITYLDGVVVADTGVVAGDDTARTPAKGAARAGQVIGNRVRVWFSDDALPSPGDPGYSEAYEETTYTPGVAAAVTTIDWTQDGLAPWVDLEWTRSAGLADEWLIERNTGDGFEQIARILGLDGGDPVWTYRDWTCPPNKDVAYRVRPFVAGAAGAVTVTTTVHLRVTGVWVFEPVVGGEVFRANGVPTAAYAEQSAWHEPIGRPTSVKRTFSLRGIEGTVAGSLRDHDDRTSEEFEASLFAIKGDPAGVYRVAYGNVNIPALLDMLDSSPHPDLSTTDRVIPLASFGFRQNGELPFPPIVP